MKFTSKKNRNRSYFAENDSKRREKSHIRLKANINPYYYDSDGMMSYNPIPYKFTNTHDDLPLMYREPGSKPITRNRIKSFLKFQSVTESQMPQDKYILDQSIYGKEVFVIKDGTIVDENEPLSGFAYKYQSDCLNQYQKQQEIASFFDKCNQEFKSTKKFKFLFTSIGKLLRYLCEIPIDTKLVLVSVKPDFIGLIEASKTFPKTERNSVVSIDIQGAKKYRSNKRLSFCESEPNESFERLNSSLSSLIESRFENKDVNSTTSHRRRGVLSMDFTTNKKDTINSLRKRSFNLLLSPVKAKPKPKTKIPRFQLLKNLKVNMGRAALRIDKDFPKLDTQGIPDLMQKYSFNEANLHKLYAQYKTLVLLSLAEDIDHDINKGVKKATFVGHFKKGSEQAGILLSRIFDSIDKSNSGCIKWQHFVKAMSVISYGSNDQQIDMFFQVYDEDHNGGLSYEEIKRICKLQLHFAVQDDIIDYLADSFAKLVFELAGLSTEKLLSPLQLKRIIAQNKEKNMVEMFCASNLL